MKVGFLSKAEINQRGILYRPKPQKESGTALRVSTELMLLDILAIVQSSLHLLFAWRFLMEKKIARSFFSNSDGRAMMMAITFFKKMLMGAYFMVFAT